MYFLNKMKLYYSKEVKLILNTVRTIAIPAQVTFCQICRGRLIEVIAPLVVFRENEIL